MPAAVSGDLHGFMQRAEEIAERLRSAETVSVVGHIDADGITASSIATSALTRAGIHHQVRYAKKIDENEISKIEADPSELVWLVDLGSGYRSHFQRKGLVISDHHIIDTGPISGPKERKGLTLFDFGEEDLQLNPHAYGFDGSTELSGAGATYFVAKAMDQGNIDLSVLAVVGAVGDFQDSGSCRLIGLNRLLVQDGLACDCLETALDLRLYGRETRPLARMFQFSSDPVLPGLTNSERGCNSFLAEMGINVKDGERWRCWTDLDEEERKVLANALCDRLLRARDVDGVKRLLGEVYMLKQEERGTELRDAKEFSTLLNSCGRYGRAEVGTMVCIGDRNERWREALQNLRKHRENLANAIEVVKQCGVVRLSNLQFLRGNGDFALPVEDTVVGIVAGMILGSGEMENLTKDVPIFAFAQTPEGKIKVSGRGTRELVEKGLDLAHAIKMAAEQVGGTGGGHNIAAGATIPVGKEQDFLDHVDSIVAAQLGR